MNVYFNPIDRACKSPIGAICNSQQLNIFVKSNKDGNCEIILFKDGETEKAFPMKFSQGGFFVCLNLSESGLYWYYFKINGEIFGCDSNLNAVKGLDRKFQLVVYDKDYKTPDWLKGGIIYQIFPDRFCNEGDFQVEKGKIKAQWNDSLIYKNSEGKVLNNQFFGGNFKGVIKKLDFLAQMGVNCIYFNPINKAFSSHRYDTGNYLEIDDVLGSLVDLETLINLAKEKGINVIFDGVYNHTGSDSLYFNKNGNYNELGAFQGEKSPYYSWYDFEIFPNKYKSWWGFESLPSIKKDSKEFQSFITEKVLKRNINLGFKGVRLDVVDELSSTFVKGIRKSVKSVDENAVIIGEVWEDATNKIAYDERKEYFLGEQLDSVMNYPLRNGIIGYVQTGNEYLLYETIINQINNYPPCSLALLMNVLSTHDSPRIISVLGCDNLETNKDKMAFEVLTESQYEKGKKLAKIAYGLSYTLYGVPSVYYGDEAGVWGNLDPYNRKTYPWGKEDVELINYFKKLGEIRKSDKVFVDGETNILYAKKGVFIFERNSETEQIIVATNLSDKDYLLTFDSQVEDILNGKSYENLLWLKSESMAIIKPKNVE